MLLVVVIMLLILIVIQIMRLIKRKYQTSKEIITKDIDKNSLKQTFPLPIIDNCHYDSNSSVRMSEITNSTDSQRSCAYRVETNHFSTRGEKLVNEVTKKYGSSIKLEEHLERSREIRQKKNYEMRFRQKTLSNLGTIHKLKKELEMAKLEIGELKKEQNINNEKQFEQYLCKAFNDKVAHSLICTHKRKTMNPKMKYDDIEKLHWLTLYSQLTQRQFGMTSDLYSGPSLSSLQRWENKCGIPSMEDFQSIDRINFVLSFWSKLYKEKYHNLFKGERINLNMSIDATKIKEMLRQDNDNVIGVTDEGISIVNRFDKEWKSDPKVYNKMLSQLLSNNMLFSHCFVFLLCPFANVKPFPVHIYFSNTGFANEEVIERMTTIQKVSHKKWKVTAISTDADRKYDSLQNMFFEEISLLIKDEVLIEKHKSLMLYPNDGMHLLKRIRSHFIKHEILYLTKKLKSQTITRSDFENLDHEIPPCVWINSSLSAMDDYFPYQLFKTSILQDALTEQKWGLVLFLIPTCAITILNKYSLPRRSKLIVAHVALFESLTYKILLETAQINNKTQKTKIAGLFSISHCMHMANYFYSTIKVLGTEERDFPFSHIGTICSEHFFGMLKNESHDQLYLSIKNAFHRKILQYKIMPEDVTRDVPHRWFDCVNAEEGKQNLNSAEVEKCISCINLLYSLCKISIPIKYDWQLIKPGSIDIIENVLSHFKDITVKKNKNSFVASCHGATIQKTCIIADKVKKQVIEQESLNKKVVKTKKQETTPALFPMNQRYFNLNKQEKTSKPQKIGYLPLMGIKNMTKHACYAITILQILVRVPDFQKILETARHPALLGIIQSFVDSYIKNNPNIEQFLRNFAQTFPEYSRFNGSTDEDPLDFYDVIVNLLDDVNTYGLRTHVQCKNLFRGKEKNTKKCFWQHIRSEIMPFITLYLTDKGENITNMLALYETETRCSCYCEECENNMITMKSNLILDLPVLLACKMPHFCDIHNFEKEIFFHRHYFLHALILKDKNHFKAAIYIKNSLYEFNDSAVNKINDEKEFFHSRNVYGAFYISKK